MNKSEQFEKIEEQINGMVASIDGNTGSLNLIGKQVNRLIEQVRKLEDEQNAQDVNIDLSVETLERILLLEKKVEER